VLELRNDTADPTYIGAINFTTASTADGQLGYGPVNGLTFRSGGTERMRIDPAGDISISDPDTTIRFPAVNTARPPMIEMFASGTGNADRMVIAHSPAFPNWGLQYQDSGDRFNFLASGSSVVSIGLGSGFQLQLSQNSACKPGGGSWTDCSDARIKKNIHPITGALDKLTRLRGVTFEWINPEDHAEQVSIQGGFIAQEVEQIFPEWVKSAPGGANDKALTPDGLVKNINLPFEFDALVVESIRQLRAEKNSEIAALKEANAALRKELAAHQELSDQLQARFVRLEKALAQLTGPKPTTVAALSQ
jgi:hypothetical protein